MERESAHTGSIAVDLAACIGFYTRLPVSAEVASFAAAQWAAPLAGAVVGLIASAALLGALWTGMPISIAAAVAIGAGMLATGALHEDGLADAADGFGGGRTREEKLAIMRDSRVGSFGVLALVVSTFMRWAALAAVTEAGGAKAVLSLIVAHAASRALLPVFMLRVPPARSDGLSAGAGPLRAPTGFAALGIGAVFLFLPGPRFALSAALLLALWFVALERLSRRQIGGQTGDVLGTLQQGGEIAILTAASATLA